MFLVQVRKNNNEKKTKFSCVNKGEFLQSETAVTLARSFSLQTQVLNALTEHTHSYISYI